MNRINMIAITLIVPVYLSLIHIFPYNIFQKWYRDTRKKVVEVQVDGAPVIGHEEQSSAIDRSV